MTDEFRKKLAAEVKKALDKPSLIVSWLTTSLSLR